MDVELDVDDQVHVQYCAKRISMLQLFRNWLGLRLAVDVIHQQSGEDLESSRSLCLMVQRCRRLSQISDAFDDLVLA